MAPRRAVTVSVLRSRGSCWDTHHRASSGGSRTRCVLGVWRAPSVDRYALVTFDVMARSNARDVHAHARYSLRAARCISPHRTSAPTATRRIQTFYKAVLCRLGLGAFTDSQHSPRYASRGGRPPTTRATAHRRASLSRLPIECPSHASVRRCPALIHIPAQSRTQACTAEPGATWLHSFRRARPGRARRRGRRRQRRLG